MFAMRLLRMCVGLAVAGLALVACSSDAAIGSEVATCDALQNDSWTDVSQENEAWRADSANFITWTDADRCLIRLDTIFHRTAAEDCDWGRVEVMSLGLPIGSPFTGPSATPPGQDWAPSFVFNTDGDFEHEPDLMPAGRIINRAEISATAVDTGARSGDLQLFIEQDESLVYVISGEFAKVFIPDPDDFLGSCA